MRKSENDEWKRQGRKMQNGENQKMMNGRDKGENAK